MTFKLYDLDKFPFEHVEGLIKDNTRLKESKVGERVALDKKIRQDFFLSTPECKMVDDYIFGELRREIQVDFGLSVRFRERYKIGFYEGEKRGFYNPHRDSWGHPHRSLSLVMCLTPKDEYEGGEFRFAELDKSFRFDRGQAVIFRPDLLHGVEPVTKGTRKVLISFLYDVEGGLAKYGLNGDLNGFEPQNEWAEKLSIDELLEARSKTSLDGVRKSATFDSSDEKDEAAEFKKSLAVLPPDSGPGNQVMAIKEAWVLSRILGRQLLCPPLRQHYTEGGQTFWNVEDLFDLKNDDARGLSMTEFSELYQKEKSPTATNLLLHSKYERALKIEEALGVEVPHLLLDQRKFKTLRSTNELRSVESDLLSLKHVFNNVHISACGVNGAYDSPMNPEFLDTYKGVCADFDFSEMIKYEAERFISDSGLASGFVAVHLRYPDYLGVKSFEEYSGYSESEVLEYVTSIFPHQPASHDQIFIATNKPKVAKDSAMRECVFYEPTEKSAETASFVEQCICSRASIFFMSPYNDYSNIGKPHQRSTWSSFVQDHRRFCSNLSEDTNVLLFSGSNFESRVE